MPTVRRRKVFAFLFRVGTFLALALVLAPAGWVLAGVVAKAAPDWQWSVLWTAQGTGGFTGGLEGPLVGTLVLMAGVLVIAGTVGVLAGVHLAELARPRPGNLPSRRAPVRCRAAMFPPAPIRPHTPSRPRRVPRPRGPPP